MNSFSRFLKGFATKFLAIFNIFSLIILPVSGLVLMPVVASAAPDIYSISGSVTVVGTVSTAQGTASVDASGANEHTIHIGIDWNEDKSLTVNKNNVETLADASVVINCSTSPCSVVWGPVDHDYALAGAGSYTAFAVVYHGGIEGRDGFESSQIAEITIVIPPQCSDGVDNDLDGDIDYPADAGCSSTTDDNESDDPPPPISTLTVVKTVITDNGGTKTASDFTMNVTATNPSQSSFAGSASGTTITLDAGSYSVDESAVSGYTKTLSEDCSGTIALGENKTCTITNDDQPGSLTVTKAVTNDNGGSLGVSDFPLFIDSVGVTSGESKVVNAGSHTVSESNATGYTATFSGDCDPTGNVTVGVGESKACTITNDDQQASLTVNKIVNITGGGTLTADDFELFVDSNPVLNGIANFLDAGLHLVSETAVFGYTGSIGGDCNSEGQITLAPGVVKTCTITNSDVAPKLTVVKVVVNDNGGTKVVSDFPLFVDDASVVSGEENTFSVGTYTVSETEVTGYNATFSGACDETGEVTLNEGDVKTCTITNDDQPGSLTVTKVVTNDNGGSLVVSDFPLFIDSVGVTSGESKVVNAGSHTVSENSTGYTATFSGDCNTSGVVVVGVGESKACTITNDDLPAKLTVTKVVINDDETSDAIVSDFSLFVGSTTVMSGVENEFDAGEYSISENGPEGYTSSFSGDCNESGGIILQNGAEYSCTITNNDIPAVVPVDTTPPVSTFDEQKNHAIIDTEIVSLNLTGSSVDDMSGVKSAEMKIYKIADSATIDEDGYFVVPQTDQLSPFGQLTCNPLPYEQVPIEIVALSLTSTGSLTATWSHALTDLDRGVYCAIVNATDNANNIEHTGIAGPFAYTYVPPAPPPTPPPAPTPTPTPSGGGNGPILSGTFGGGPIFGGGIVLGTSTAPVGNVLGVSTEECSKYLTAYIRFGRQNDKDQVLRLQRFLNSLEGSKINESGAYDQLSLSAVNAFQTKYSNDILKPWGANGPTGYVYYTTQKKVNEIYCKFTKTFPLNENQLAEIERIRKMSEAGAIVPASSSAPATQTSPANEKIIPTPSQPELVPEIGSAPQNSQAASVSETNKKGFWSRVFKKIFGR